MKSARRAGSGQAAVEYTLLLCSVLVLTQLTMAWLHKNLPAITENLLGDILFAALSLGSL